MALIPSADVALVQESHQVVPDVAVVAHGEGPVSMRVPIRPDEIQQSPVRLYHASGTAEVLARATVQPFYGIQPSVWTAEDSTEARVVIVEGAEAVRRPEAGFAEDLCRAWFILTGQPVVSHVLVAPKALDRAAVAPALAIFDQLVAVSHDRRRDLRRDLVERHDLDRDRLTGVLAAQRLRLDDDDRRALLMLLQKGNKGSSYPYLWQLTFLEPSKATT